MILRWWRNYQKRKDCFHHQLGSLGGTILPVSFITDTLIDCGQRKLFRCHECGKIWIF